ncbi:STM4015 family protein [Spirillospora sp. NPDC048819]|uniref:STM4015 family protein n=1 Tax=Spirillospora sp. NPDC048819 TaxID=3155268 RepID=UPI0033F95AEB
MPNRKHLPEFAGLRTIDFPSREELDTRLLRARYKAEEQGLPKPDAVPPDEAFVAAKADPGGFAWRLLLMPFGDEEDFRTYLERFIAEIDTPAVTALIVGNCWDPGPANDHVDAVRDALVEHAGAFPALRALFFGEVTREEADRFSWIAQTDVSPLLAAFPGLREFVVRGADEMTFGGSWGTFTLAWNLPRHETLRRLTIETHRLDPAVVRGVLSSDLPMLEHLELYLGARDGDGASPEDLAPVLAGSAFPSLTSLALRNGQDTNALVAALADAPVTSRLSVLDLSLGTLTDKGAQILLDTPVFLDLDRLDLHYHHMSEEMTERVRGRFTESGVGIDVGERQELEEYEDEDDDDEYEEEPIYPAIVD